MVWRLHGLFLRYDMKAGIIAIVIIYATVIGRVTFINEADSIMIQKVGYF